jgi:ComF family protein
MPTRLDSALERIGGWWLPTRCVLCGGSGQPPSLDLCRDCELELPVVPPVCRRCGAPRAAAADTDESTGCRHCASDPPPFANCLAAFAYLPPVDLLIQALKYHGRLALGRVLGELLARAVASSGLGTDVDAVVPIPLHPSRHAERGFNQAAEIARWTSRRLDLECASSGARRSVAGPSQVSSSPAQRRANLRGAFTADPRRVDGRAIAVIDDVLTTGSTASALTHAMLQAGARRVDVWCVALAGSARSPGAAGSAVTLPPPP